MTVDDPGPSPSHIHLIPHGEEGHSRAADCSCLPFLYDVVPVGLVEVRHNSFAALPVDEGALEAAQRREHGSG